MFVYSLRASKLKLAGLIVLSAAVLAAAVTFFVSKDSDQQLHEVAAMGKDIRFDGIKTEEDVIEFTESVGISVKSPAVKTADVDLPRIFDAVYSRYNDIQKQQGFDLSKYCGKTLRRYTFEVTNYPVPEGKDGKVYLTLFVHKNKVVGGDISSRDFGGFVRTFLDFGRA